MELPGGIYPLIDCERDHNACTGIMNADPGVTRIESGFNLGEYYSVHRRTILTRVQAIIKAIKWATLTFHEENGRYHRCPPLERFDDSNVAAWAAVWEACCETP